MPEDLTALRERLANNALPLLRFLGLRGHKQGTEFRAINPVRDDKSLGSFSIAISGQRRGFWGDFAVGAGGKNLLDLICYVRTDGNFKDAIRVAKDFLGDPLGDTPYQPTESILREHAKRNLNTENLTAIAKRIWAESQVLKNGDPVRGYLEGRGLSLLTMPSALRYNPHCWASEVGRPLPAMVARINTRGKMVGIHRTWLNQDQDKDGGWGKAKLKSPRKMLGIARGGGVWLPAEGTPASATHTIYLAEGIEDALQVSLGLTEAKLQARVVAVLGVANFTSFILPPETKEVHLCPDNDPEGSIARQILKRAVGRFQRDFKAEVWVHRPPNGMKDFGECSNLFIQTG